MLSGGAAWAVAQGYGSEADLERIEERLAALGITLTEAKAPVANYLGTKQVGDTLYVSARVSERKGAVDGDVSLGEAYDAARATAVLLLAIVKADIADLDRIDVLVTEHLGDKTRAVFEEQGVEVVVAQEGNNQTCRHNGD